VTEIQSNKVYSYKKACKMEANSLCTDLLLANRTRYNVSPSFKNEYRGYLY